MKGIIKITNVEVIGSTAGFLRVDYRTSRGQVGPIKPKHFYVTHAEIDDLLTKIESELLAVGCTRLTVFDLR